MDEVKKSARKKKTRTRPEGMPSGRPEGSLPEGSPPEGSPPEASAELRAAILRSHSGIGIPTLPVGIDGGDGDDDDDNDGGATLRRPDRRAIEAAWASIYGVAGSDVDLTEVTMVPEMVPPGEPQGEPLGLPLGEPPPLYLPVPPLPPPPRRYNLLFCFRKMDEKASAFLQNRLTAWWTECTYIHCEVYDPQERRALLITDRSDGLRFTDRPFVMNTWDFVCFNIDQAGYRRFLDYVETTLQTPKQLDTWGIFLKPFEAVRPESPGYTTCSREAAGVINAVWRIPLPKPHSYYTPADIAFLCGDLSTNPVHGYVSQRVSYIENYIH